MLLRWLLFVMLGSFGLAHETLTFWLTLVTVLFVTMILFLGTVWLIRTVVVLQGVGIWPLVAIAVTGSLFGFVVGSLELRRAVSEST